MDKAAALDSYTANTLALIEQLPDPASVILTGHEVEDVTGYYRAADVFAFASEREGLPNAVLEAMACGLPCLLAPYAGFPRNGEELGTARTHFLTCDHSEASIAAGMLELLSDATKRTTMGNHARQQMSEEQSLPMILDQWSAAYQRAAKAWGAP